MGDENYDVRANREKNDPNEEYKGMPRYDHTKNEEFYAEVVFRFKTKKDAQEFGELIGQHVTDKTRGIRIPPKIPTYSVLEWIDKDDLEEYEEK